VRVLRRDLTTTLNLSAAAIFRQSPILRNWIGT
jgi:hypothetical protein